MRDRLFYPLALSTFALFVLARILLQLHRTDLPWLSSVAFVWQDALIALIVAGVEKLGRPARWVKWGAYVLLIAYVAINAAVIRVLSAPLTMQMLSAAGTALSDSIRYYLTAPNIFLIACIILAGAIFPWVAAHTSYAHRRLFIFAALLLSFVGWSAGFSLSGHQLTRNPVLAMVQSTIPRIAARAHEQNWRNSPFGGSLDQDLTFLRGIASDRNIILISLESTGAEYVKAGGSENPMPNVSAVARHAVIFDSSYAVYPESIKGLFSVLCSRYPAIDTDTEQHAAVRTPAIGHVLAQAGYTNALFHSGRFMYLGMDDIIENRAFHLLADAGAISGNFNSSFGTDEPSTVVRMLDWIDSLPENRRFFLTYLPIAGHHPYDAPEAGPFPDHTERGRYLNALHYGDRALGQFFEALRERDLFTNTLFVIFGDHGEAFGQHEGNYGHTLHIYEENVRVPLLFAVPGALDGPIHVRRSASLLDVSPTILDLLGEFVPDEFDGASLLMPQERMALFFTDYSLGLLGLRDGNWKYIYEIESGHSKLFELNSDPAETINLADRFEPRRDAYRTLLMKWAAAQRFRILTKQT